MTEPAVALEGATIRVGAIAVFLRLGRLPIRCRRAAGLAGLSRAQALLDSAASMSAFIASTSWRTTKVRPLMSSRT